MQKIRKTIDNAAIICLIGSNYIKNSYKLFDIGIDDCLEKPFAIKELAARVKRNSSRYQNKGNNQQNQQIDDLAINTQSRTANRGDTKINLREKEFQLLEFLIQHPHSILQREYILQHVWENHMDLYTNTVDVHIGSLRKKIDFPSKKPLIHTVYGLGYKFTDQDD